MKNLLQLILVFAVSVSTLQAKTIKVSSKSGSSTEKLKNAYNEAKSGDIILIDLDVVFENNDKHLSINKSGLTFKGAEKQNGEKFKLTRLEKKRSIFVLSVGYTSFENLTFSTATNLLRVEANKKTLSHIAIKDCEFLNSKYIGVDFRGDFTDILVENSLFDGCKFGLQTMDSEILKNFIVKKSIFKRGDHQISIDNAFTDSNKIDHENIVIDDCEFFVAERFNIALANTRNAKIINNRMDGGLQTHSQAIHIGHDTRDLLIKNNILKNDVGNAIIIFSTGYVKGHKITEKEKFAFGSSNITLDGNTITNSKEAAVMIGYGKGYLKILGNNIINSEDEIVKAYNTKNTMSFDIDDKVVMNGKKYSEIKNEDPSKKLEEYIFVKS